MGDWSEAVVLILDFVEENHSLSEPNAMRTALLR
jgi:hypothetical protein